MRPVCYLLPDRNWNRLMKIESAHRNLTDRDNRQLDDFNNYLKLLLF